MQKEQASAQKERIKSISVAKNQAKKNNIRQYQN
jgi:hypothetical protein